ncbi:anti-repressor SinI family protein [Evansella halocellulosilytica]|uniref:anti-repressor SinI family protein n=1 Tax=Evansella halocellulosilytica TaxID=2011013 RepID=UPI00211BD7B7|nr:anti-repressor SinI family protein [Evansella halocellulosilytica]
MKKRVHGYGLNICNGGIQKILFILSPFNLCALILMIYETHIVKVMKQWGDNMDAEKEKIVQDQEWEELILEAKELGLSVKEVQRFFYHSKMYKSMMLYDRLKKYEMHCHMSVK